METIYITLLSLVCGWLGSMASKYFSEKGKNLATKEDIAEITEKIESVKNQYSQKHLKSITYIEKQIQAFVELDEILHDFKIHYFERADSDTSDLTYYKYFLLQKRKGYFHRLVGFNEKRSLYVPKHIEGDILAILALGAKVEEIVSYGDGNISPYIEPISDCTQGLRNSIKKELLDD